MILGHEMEATPLLFLRCPSVVLLAYALPGFVDVLARPDQLAVGGIAGDAAATTNRLRFTHLLWLYSPLGPLLGPAALVVGAGGAILAAEDHRLRRCCRFATAITGHRRSPEEVGEVFVAGKRRRWWGGGGICRPPVHRVDFTRERVDFLPFTRRVVDGRCFGPSVIITRR